MAVSGLAFGADGIIGSTYNLLTDLFLRIVSAYGGGDLPRGRGAPARGQPDYFTCLKYDLMPVLKLA
jgi:dihydrodipicolinate synthase/N-acetylneuraminate lyase